MLNNYYQPYWLNNDELEHFGIKGQKWGLRRYQNPDGTLTDAGRKRYGTEEKFQEHASKKYEKAGSKLERLDNKAKSLSNKGARREQKALSKQQRASSAILFPRLKAKRASRATRKALKAYQKSQVAELKAYRWNEKMQKKFRDVKINNMDSKYVTLGEKYAKNSIDNIMKNNISVNAIMDIDKYYRDIARK